MKYLAIIVALWGGVARAETFDPAAAGLPAAERFELDSGLTVVFVPNAANPYLDVQLAFRAGTGADPKDREGVASLLSGMMTAGVPGLDEAAFAAEIARLGGWIGSEANPDSFALGGHIPTLSDKDVRAFLGLFAAATLQPTLPEAIVTRDKALRADLFQRMADDANTLRRMAAREAVFGKGPFGASGYGTPASVGRITRDDLRAYHAAVFNPKHGVLLIGGAFEPKGMRAWVARTFGAAAWPKDQRATDGVLPGYKARLCAKVEGTEACFDNAHAAPPVVVEGGARTIHVVIDDEGLTQIPWTLVAHNPISQLDARWAAFQNGAFVLGGEFISRLNALLRTKEGLTYGAYFGPGFGAHYSGTLGVFTDATPDALTKAIALTKAELTRIGREPIAATELEQHRAMLVNGFAFRFETMTDTDAQYMSLVLDGLPLRWLAEWKANIQRPSAADIQATMAAVDPGRMALVVVGPPSIAAVVSQLGHGPVTTVTAEALIAHGLP